MIRRLAILVLGLSWCCPSTATAQFFESSRHLLPTSLQQSFEDGDCTNLMPRWPLSFFNNSTSGLSEESAPAVIAFSYFDNVGFAERIIVRYRIGGSSGRTSETFGDSYEFNETSITDEVVWLAANAEYGFEDRHTMILVSEEGGPVRRIPSGGVLGVNGWAGFTGFGTGERPDFEIRHLELTTEALLRGGGTVSTFTFINANDELDDGSVSDGLTVVTPTPPSPCLAPGCFDELTLDFVTLSYSPTATGHRVTFPDSYQENDELLLRIVSTFTSFYFGYENVTQLRVSTLPPDNVVKGDVNLSGTVDFADIAPFIEVLQSGTYQAEADCDCDFDVDVADIPAMIEILLNQ